MTETVVFLLTWLPNQLYTFVDILLRTLYFEGPTFWGMWGGQEPAAICQELTGVTARHWDASFANKQQCEVEMERGYRQFFIGFMTFLTLFIVYKLIQYLITYCFFVRPILVTLQRLSPFRSRRRAIVDAATHIVGDDSPSIAVTKQNQ